jgi:hypothetical protein
MANIDVQMHWSSIFSGAFLTLGFVFFFLLLGNAIGLNAVNSVTPGVGGTLQFWSWIYMAATMIFSFFAGAFLSTRSTRIETPSSGMAHGLTSWGVATAVLLIGGSVASFGVRLLLAGLADNAANWLAVAVFGGGAVAAMVGGMAGKYSRPHVVPSATQGEMEQRRAS